MTAPPAPPAPPARRSLLMIVITLIAFGLGLLFARPKLAAPTGRKSELWEHTGIIPQTFFLTVTNPGAILGMAAMIGGLGSLIGGLKP